MESYALQKVLKKYRKTSKMKKAVMHNRLKEKLPGEIKAYDYSTFQCNIFLIELAA